MAKPVAPAASVAAVQPVATDTGVRAAVDAAVLEALELPLNGPRRFWLGFVFTDDSRLAERARELAEEIVRGRGRTLEVYRAEGAGDVEAIARAVAGREPAEDAVWVDWSAFASRDRGEIERGLAMLNTGRTRLSRALRGGLVIAAPSWAEEALARGAVDLWSGSEFALRLRRERATEAAKRTRPGQAAALAPPRADCGPSRCAGRAPRRPRSWRTRLPSRAGPRTVSGSRRSPRACRSSAATATPRRSERLPLSIVHARRPASWPRRSRSRRRARAITPPLARAGGPRSRRSSRRSATTIATRSRRSTSRQRAW